MNGPLAPEGVIDRAFEAAWNARRTNEASRVLSAVDQHRAIVTAAVGVVLTDLHALIFPEHHPGYDPEHRFWDGKTPEEIAALDPVEDAFQWDSETIELIADRINQLIQATG